MSLRRILRRHTVTIVEPPSASRSDRYRDPDPDWAAAARRPSPGRLEQTAATEISIGRDTLISDWQLTLPIEAVITGACRVEAAEGVFEVVGTPARLDSSPRTAHIEARLRLVTEA